MAGFKGARSHVGESHMTELCGCSGGAKGDLQQGASKKLWPSVLRPQDQQPGRAWKWMPSWTSVRGDRSSGQFLPCSFETLTAEHSSAMDGHLTPRDPELINKLLTAVILLSAIANYTNPSSQTWTDPPSRLWWQKCWSATPETSLSSSLLTFSLWGEAPALWKGPGGKE